MNEYELKWLELTERIVQEWHRIHLSASTCWSHSCFFGRSPLKCKELLFGHKRVVLIGFSFLRALFWDHSPSPPHTPKRKCGTGSYLQPKQTYSMFLPPNTAVQVKFIWNLFQEWSWKESRSPESKSLRNVWKKVAAKERRFHHWLRTPPPGHMASCFVSCPSASLPFPLPMSSWLYWQEWGLQYKG